MRDPIKYPDPMQMPILQHPKTNIVRITVAATSMFAVYCLVQRHRYKYFWKQHYYNDDLLTYSYFQYFDVLSTLKSFTRMDSTIISPHLVIELLLLMVNPIPYYDRWMPHQVRRGQIVNYFLSEYMLSIMAYRGFYIFRAYFNYSEFTDPYAKKLCQSYGFNANLRFALKAKMENEPLKMTALITGLFVMFYAYLIRLFELPYYRMAKGEAIHTMDGYFTAVYMTIVTMMTVGYGDLAPNTTPGRLTAM